MIQLHKGQVIAIGLPEDPDPERGTVTRVAKDGQWADIRWRFSDGSSYGSRLELAGLLER